MAISKPRNKYVIFRLTQDEYDTLQSASSGARSLSDFARTKLLGSLMEPDLDEHLIQLKTTVARIAALLEQH